MLQATPEQLRTLCKAGAVAHTTTSHSFLEQSDKACNDENPVWQPAAPRLRLFSPATPRPCSATSASPRRYCPTRAATHQLSPPARPISAFSGGMPLSQDHQRDRIVLAAVTSPGATAPATPTSSRAAHILHKTHVMQSRTAAAMSYPPALASVASPTGTVAVTVAAATKTSLSVPHPPVDSPPGSPLVVVRSIPRPQNPRPPQPTSTFAVHSPSGRPSGTGRHRRSSLPDPLLYSSSSGGTVHLSPPAMARNTAEASESSKTGTTVAVAAANKVASQPSALHGNSLHGSITNVQRRRPARAVRDRTGRNGLFTSGNEVGRGGGAGGIRSDGDGDDGRCSTCGGDGGSNTALDHRQMTACSWYSSSVASDGGADVSAGEGHEHYHDATTLPADAIPSESRLLPQDEHAACNNQTYTVPSAPVTWPWPQQHDNSRSLIVAGASPQSSLGTSVTLPLVTLTNYQSTGLHQHQIGISLPYADVRGGSLGGSPVVLRGNAGMGLPTRLSTPAAVLLTSRSIRMRTRPRSMSVSGTGWGGDGAVIAPISISSYEIIPDLHSGPAAAAAATPLGPRVARAIAGVLPCGNPGTFNLNVNERIDKVMNESAPKAPRAKSPPSPPPPPNPTVLKMLYDRHEAEAQRSRVETAFSSGDPSVWMHQIMAESCANTPPGMQQQQQQKQQQNQQQKQEQKQHRQRQQAQSPKHSRSGNQSFSAGRKLARQPSYPPLQQGHRSTLHQQQLQHPMSKAGNAFGLTTAFAADNPAAVAAAAAAASPRATAVGLPYRPVPISVGIFGPGVSRHTSAETLHLQSLSYLASKEACRTLAADSKPAVGINLREVLFEGAPMVSTVLGAPNLK